MNNFPTSAIQVNNLTKIYPQETSPALNNVSFQINAHEKVGLIGANGSGKSTLFRLLLNILKPDQGYISIMGETDLEKTKKYLGFVGEYQEGLENFTPGEILSFSGKMSNLSKDMVSRRKKDLLAWAKLESCQNNLIAGFSKGMRQRLFLTAALVHQPQILLLDEPMSGLDPGSQNDFRKLVEGLESQTLLYASHQLSEVEDICRRVIIFRQGELIKDLNLDEFQEDIFIIESDSSILPLLEKFTDITLLQKSNRSGGLSIEISTTQKIFQIFFSTCQDKGVPIRRFKSKSILEDVYDKLVKGSE